MDCAYFRRNNPGSLRDIRGLSFGEQLGGRSPTGLGLNLK
jgi:hypothetical protein